MDRLAQRRLDPGLRQVVVGYHREAETGERSAKIAREAVEVGADVDMCQVLVQNRVGLATPLLPDVWAASHPDAAADETSATLVKQGIPVPRSSN